MAKVKMDIHQIPFPDHSFDVVLCNHVLEHVEDDIKAMTEIWRVLRPGGWSLMQVPFFSPVPDVTFEDHTISDAKEREKVFGQSDHVRKFGRDYTDRISRSGLVPEANTFAKLLPAEERKKFAIEGDEIIYIGRKTQ